MLCMTVGRHFRGAMDSEAVEKVWQKLASLSQAGGLNENMFSE